MEVLEAIYTDRTFPKKSPVLEMSLKESGKSRADLWSLAGLVAVEYGIETNNLKVDRKYLENNKNIWRIIKIFGPLVRGPRVRGRVSPPAGRGRLLRAAQREPPLQDGARGLRPPGIEFNNFRRF